MDPVETALLDAIARDPEDPGPYLVYADWLQGRGALRGELMTLQNAVEDRPGDHRISDAALDHVRAHADYYLGELASLVDEPEFLALGWRCGFIASAELTWNRRWRNWRRPPTEDTVPSTVLRALLRLDSARFLTRLVVEPTHQVDARFIGAALAAHPPATLRQLWIGPRDSQSGRRDCELGELSFEGMPHLRELVVHGDVQELRGLALPELRSTTIMLMPGATYDVLRNVAKAAWPNLERLHLWSPNAITSTLAVLGRDDLPLLGDLGIINAFTDLAFCDALARSPLAPQLYRLSLARGTLNDAGVDVLVARRGDFPSLATLDVSETFVTPAGVARLRTVASEVVARDLRTGIPRPLIPPITRTDEDGF